MTVVPRSDAREFTPKGLARRDRIIEAAAQVILEHGLTGFNIDLVRQRAGASGSQLTHYFTDKQTLVREVIERQIAIVLRFHRDSALDDLDDFEDWEQWRQMNLRYLRKIGYSGTPTYHTLAGQLAKTDDSIRQALEHGYQRWVELLQQSFQRMKDRGLLNAKADARHLALVVVGAHQGAGVLGYAYRQEWPLADITRFVVNYIRLFAARPEDRIKAKPSRQPPRHRSRIRGADHAAEDARFTRKGRATRSRIIESTAELIYERGINGTTLEEIRAAAGVSGSQLAHYFIDKADLTHQVIRARAAFVENFNRQPVFGSLDSAAAFRKWAEICWIEAGAAYLRNGCVYGSLTAELLEADEQTLDELSDGYNLWFNQFHDGLKSMHKQGRLADDADPRHLAAVLLIAHQGATMLTHICASPEPFGAVMFAAVEYLESYAKSPERQQSSKNGSRARADRR